MCLDIRKNTKIHTASKDITVFKRLLSDNGKYLSPYYGGIYRLNKTKSVPAFGGYSENTGKLLKFTSEVPEGIKSIENGLHAYRSIDAARYNWNSYNLIRCIIPKGTPYIVAKGEIVSLKLRPVNEVPTEG